MNIMGCEDLLKLALRSEYGIVVTSSDRVRLAGLVKITAQKSGNPAYVSLRMVNHATEENGLLITKVESSG